MKRKILLLTVSLIVMVSSIASYAAETFNGKCVGVSDGDTISVLRNNREIKIRVEGIDCPEKKQDFGNRAKQFTSKMVFGKMITVKVVKIDHYGRSVSRVYVAGKALSLELVKAGLAWHYKEYSRDPVLAKAEEEARGKKIGLWSMRNPMPPWDFRHRNKH